MLAGLLSALAGLSAVVLVLIAWTMGDQPYWLLTGMECCVIAAGVVGVLFARKRFGDGPAMTLTCIAGTIAVASFLGWLSLYRGGMQVGMTLRGSGGGGGKTLPMTGWLVARVACASLLVLLASIEALGRDRASRRYIFNAIATGGALVVVGGGLWIGRGWLMSQSIVPAWVVWTIVSLGAVLAMGLFCACLHCIIRAFEMGRVNAATPTVTRT
jgi:hypothetical protein